MPFGKHRDKSWEEVPTSYLLWCVNAGAGQDYPGFQDQIRTLLRQRGVSFPEQYGFDFNEEKPKQKPEPETPPNPPPVTPHFRGVNRARVTELISAGRRALACRYHPDVNKQPGAVIGMQEVNAAADWLEKCRDTLP